MIAIRLFIESSSLWRSADRPIVRRVWMKWTLAGLILAGVALTVAIVIGTWRQLRITAEKPAWAQIGGRYLPPGRQWRRGKAAFETTKSVPECEYLPTQK